MLQDGTTEAESDKIKLNPNPYSPSRPAARVCRVCGAGGEGEGVAEGIARRAHRRAKVADEWGVQWLMRMLENDRRDIDKRCNVRR